MGWDNTEIGEEAEFNGNLILIIMSLFLGFPFYSTVIWWIYKIFCYLF